MQRRVIVYLYLEDTPCSAGAFPRSSGAGTWSYLQLKRQTGHSLRQKNLSRLMSQRRVSNCTPWSRACSSPLARLCLGWGDLKIACQLRYHLSGSHTTSSLWIREEISQRPGHPPCTGRLLRELEERAGGKHGSHPGGEQGRRKERRQREVLSSFLSPRSVFL